MINNATWERIGFVRNLILGNSTKFEELQVLGELAKQLIISNSPLEIVLNGNFNKSAINYVLFQLGMGVESVNYRLIVFPNSKTTTIQFVK